MKIVNKYFVLATIILITISSCRGRRNVLIEKDISGSNNFLIFQRPFETTIDTFLLRFEHHYYNLYQIHESTYTKIIGITSLIGDEYISTVPPIEKAHIEGNYIQTDKAGIRILIRNTDLKPDCMYMDLTYDKEWNVESIGKISTQDSCYIVRRQIRRPVRLICNNELNCSLMEISIQYPF